MKYWLHPEAERDLELIIERYLRRFGRQAAERFLVEYERIRSLVTENPDLGTRLTRGRQMYPLKAVPYLIVYRAYDDWILILIIRHQHRKPRLGSRRN